MGSRRVQERQERELVLPVEAAEGKRCALPVVVGLPVSEQPRPVAIPRTDLASEQVGRVPEQRRVPC